MKRRIVILTEIIAPYRIPVFNALAARPDADLHVIFLSETDPGLRQWHVYRNEIRFSHEVLRSYRGRVAGFNMLLTRGMSSALKKSDPQVIVAGGYNYLAMWEAQRWARKRGVPFLLWSESNVSDARRNFRWVEAAKRKFIRSGQGYVVPGTSAASYLKTFGVAEDRIFVAPNAVDAEQFLEMSVEARRDPNLRVRLRLPDRYVLYVGRFVRSKGVFDLLDAYATLPKETRQVASLVMVGDGPEREELVRRSRAIDGGETVFPGFLQRDELPALYALADVLVLPTYSDTWGLVVNEAMACGLPVIVTRAAGCVADMVKHGENGFLTDVGDVPAMSQAMKQIVNDPGLRERLGRCSMATSARFTPQMWAEGIAEAAGKVGARVG
ncbi:MAG TPA: glycosyltransferase [Terriglobales bacterium]|nr:glycosyltransferase [Terriglobales bacterium]